MKTCTKAATARHSVAPPALVPSNPARDPFTSSLFEFLVHVETDLLFSAEYELVPLG